MDILHNILDKNLNKVYNIKIIDILVYNSEYKIDEQSTTN